ncbi:MAG TPA: hypothetical protein VK211_15730 [Kamptonema sp.]|nr:hypothetical protein [Kamptonema sp.]
MSRIKDDRVRFRGICLDGPLKGKEIEGKLNIELDIESIRSSRSSSDSGFGSVVVILLLLLGVNYLAVQGTNFRRDRPSQASTTSTPQELPQYELQFTLDDAK